ncbi:MAG: hypothetical protein GC149_17965 [Gammaproteobacteria bacterium]|nr:hypothetical protein [Gammaproteobacteria bacterium]
MDKAQLKQRIVGAIVLVALGVIFIPMILNREDSSSGISGTNIPLKPAALEKLATESAPPPPPAVAPPAQTTQLVDKDTPALPKADATLEQENAAQNKTEPATPPAGSKEPKVSPADKTAGWVIQVASFTDRNKALKLRDRLLKAKYNCYVESTTGKHGTLYRVRVGPVTKREEADKLQAKLARQLKLKGTLILAYP